MSCNVYDAVEGHLDSSTVSTPSPAVIGWSYATPAVHRALEFDAPASIRVECIGGDGVGVGIRLSATTVGEIVEQ